MSIVERPSVGLIGVGLLGLAVARRLMGAGYTVLGWDISEARLDALQAWNGKRAGALGDVFELTQRIVLSLPDSTVVRAVLDGAPLTAGQIIIDTTTGDPLATEMIAQELESLGVSYLDATILGSSELVADGEAVALVGATDEGLARSRDILAAIVQEFFHLGLPGGGAKMKLVANLVLGLHRAVLAEGLALASAYGMDLVRVLEVLKVGATYSRVMDAKGAKMISRDFQPQARLRQHLKDVGLIRKEAERLAAIVPLSDLHQRLLSNLVERGYGDEDNSAIVRAFDS